MEGLGGGYVPRPYEPRGTGGQSSSFRASGGQTVHNNAPSDNSRGCYVGNIDSSITAAELRRFFSSAGTVVSVNLMGPENGTHRYAFIDFTTEEERNRAIQMYNGYSTGGRQLKVAESKGTNTGSGSGSAGGAQARGAGGVGGITNHHYDPNRTLSNHTPLQDQLMKELALQQYAAALELEHAKLLHRTKEKAVKKAKKELEKREKKDAKKREREVKAEVM